MLNLFPMMYLNLTAAGSAQPSPLWYLGFAAALALCLLMTRKRED